MLIGYRALFVALQMSAFCVQILRKTLLQIHNTYNLNYNFSVKLFLEKIFWNAT